MYVMLRSYSANVIFTSTVDYGICKLNKVFISIESVSAESVVWAVYLFLACAIFNSLI